VIVKIRYAGVNASDINYTAGKYRPGLQPPFDAGFEGLGTIFALSSDLNQEQYPLGQAVVVTGYGCYSEYMVVPAKTVIAIPRVEKNILPLLVSGLTASVALEQVAQLSSNQTVLVTAAAGGTGQFAVQIARQAGNHVIGTCSSDSKVKLLQELGCHRVVNYKKENLDHVLKTEYPKGVDIVYESVGGEMFKTCVKHLAVNGKLVIIGMISGYESGAAWSSNQNPHEISGGELSASLLTKSASVRGFFLFHYRNDWARHMMELFSLVETGKLQSIVDQSQPFVGLESVSKAIQYLYSGQNQGKVVVTISEEAKL